MTVKEIIEDYLGLEEGQVTDASTLEELGIDSLDRIELTMLIEEELCPEGLSDEGLETARTVGDLEALIK